MAEGCLLNARRDLGDAIENVIFTHVAAFAALIREAYYHYDPDGINRKNAAPAREYSSWKFYISAAAGVHIYDVKALDPHSPMERSSMPLLWVDEALEITSVKKERTRAVMLGQAIVQLATSIQCIGAVILGIRRIARKDAAARFDVQVFLVAISGVVVLVQSWCLFFINHEW
ncbi:hypothetical protein L228DRAFT_285114 [Xylona heveae TC161]|uniref:Uncharacterized protein n=1 Tax=Xylona heveae (strain CBS 132557 / TC161) TaxID=1328760 RepID=A0A165AFU8_XYLHT|nr:hypothetical protein L228DRAFT_285114 [Xylona heveae TC161]KZF20406.1 hypothetical protein L228DRAFT_285114 [Xylona heveae TC161]